MASSSERKTNGEGTDQFWTKEKCLELIQFYKDRNILWDSKHPYYYRKNMKIDTWEELSIKVGVTVPEVKTKLNVLLSSFRREKAKTLKQIRWGNNKNYTSPWFAYKALSFLLNKERKNKETATLNLLAHRAPIRTYNKRQVKKEVNTKPSQSTHREPEDTSQTEDADDEITSFTNFLASKIRKYSRTTKSAVQQAICDILFKADQKMYEPTKYLSSTSAAVINIPPGDKNSSRKLASLESSDDSMDDKLVIVKHEPFDDDSS